MLKDLIVELAGVLKNRDDDYVQRVENILGQISSLDDQDCIRLLLPFLDDNAEYDEMIFSIVHTIEQFDDDTYINELLTNISSLFSKSPRWTIILHMRILNSQTALDAYEARIKTLSDQQKPVVLDVLNALRKKNAKFEPVCSRLMNSI